MNNPNECTQKLTQEHVLTASAQHLWNAHDAPLWAVYNMDTPVLLTPEGGYPPLFWDYSKAGNLWGIVRGFFWRCVFRLHCSITTGHAPMKGRKTYMGDRGPWWLPCRCGYFGVPDPTSQR